MKEKNDEMAIKLYGGNRNRQLEYLTGADEPVNFPLYEFSGRSEGEDTSNKTPAHKE